MDGWNSSFLFSGFSGDTLPKTNIAPKNGWLEYYFPIGDAYFQGRTVSFREGMLWLLVLRSVDGALASVFGGLHVS